MSIRGRRGPIWTSPAPGSRQPRWSREEIARTALAIADREGFDAVSMRRIASELGTGTMTLYYYVRTKDDLVVLMDDAIMAEVIVPDERMPKGWRDRLATVARASHAAFIRHPWALKHLQGARLGPNSVRHMEQSLAALDDLPIDTYEKLEILATVDDFVFGHALRMGEMAAVQLNDRAQLRTITDYIAGEIEREGYPHMRALLEGDAPDAILERMSNTIGGEVRFERGLLALIDGLAGKYVPARANGSRRRSPAKR